MPCSARARRPSRPCILDRRKRSLRSLRSLLYLLGEFSTCLRRPRCRTHAQGEQCPKVSTAACTLEPFLPLCPSCRPEGRSREWISACESPVLPPKAPKPVPSKAAKVRADRGHLLEDTRFEPPLRLLVDRLPRRQVVGHVRQADPVLTIHLSPWTSRRSCSAERPLDSAIGNKCPLFV